MYFTERMKICITMMNSKNTSANMLQIVLDRLNFTTDTIEFLIAKEHSIIQFFLVRSSLRLLAFK